MGEAMFLVGALVWGAAAPLAGGTQAASGALRVAVFRADATPPAGAFRGGWNQALVRIEEPLWAKGVVLDDGRTRCVLCAVDWCTLSNGSHTTFRRKLAQAAGIEPRYVAVHCVHQHTAPSVDGDAQRLLDGQPEAPKISDLAALEAIADRVAAAVRDSLQRLETVDRVGLGQARVERVAATRRVLGPDGKIRVRWSACTDPALRAEPEGLIDPMLKTTTLAQGERPVVRLHYYATHPQSRGNDGRIGNDFPGMARDRLEAAEKVPQIYFTGCAGDVTAGKYNDGSPEAKEQLAQRMQAGMEAAIQASRFYPAASLEWRTLPVRFPLRSEVTAEAENRQVLANPKATVAARASAAGRLAFAARQDQPIELILLRLGPALVLHLPGEPMVEFQLYAQRLMPQRFVAVAGYGDGGTGYVCTAQAHREGGYEPGASRIAPEGEAVLKKALAQLLAP